MALVEDKYTESTDGIKKTIDKNSMGMALDILQRGLYAYPIQSTVRELASNGYDAIKERDIAKALLLGTEKVEDHFDVTKTNGVYHASGWDPTYFDPQWLSSDPHVYLYYEEGDQKDTLRIVDHGVGLGKSRLVNYFMLNWSSKRANKDSLGRFGLGSKVALSLGVDSFRVITRYNGKKFKFDVYLDKVESIISKFGPKGQANEPFILVPEKSVIEEDGTTSVIPAYIAYCENTTDKNGVEIQIEIKKHNKKLFFDAIEAQLMYMPNIKFMHRELNRVNYTEIPIAAKILYRDENVVISESTIFDKPHVLLGTGNALINYGFVSFKDLELEPKRGSVGLIMDINDIEVTPSRESPLWSTKTRTAILAKYKKVSEMASEYLNRELSSETDYLKWLGKAAQILSSIRSGGSNSTVLSRLASIINVDEIGDIKYPSDTKIKYDYAKTRTMFGNSLTVRIIQYDSYRHKVDRKNLEDLGSLAVNPIYFTKEGSNPFKDRYLYEEGGSFILINVKEGADTDERGDYVLASKAFMNYDDVKVPQDRMDIYLADSQNLSEDDNGTSALAAPAVDYSAQRKANKQIVVHVLNGEGSTYDYKFGSTDVYISELFTKFKDNLVVYTTGGDRETLSNLLAIFPKYMLTIRHSGYFETISKASPMPIPIKSMITGVLVAQENVKYIKGSSKYMSMADLVVKQYNPKTETVTFSDLMRYTATNSALNSIFNEKYDGSVANVACVNTKYVDPKFQQIANFLCEYYGTSSSRNYSYHNLPPKDIMSTNGFLRNAVLYQLYNEKIIEASDETIEELKKTLNSEVPDYLCDVVDSIDRIEILNMDTLREYIDLFDYYKDHRFIFDLLRHHSMYDTAGLEELAPSIINYFKYVNEHNV